MSENQPQVSLFVNLENGDEVRAAEDAISLARDLRQLDVYSVEPASSSEPPPGTRSVDVVSGSSLIILAAGAKIVLRSVLDTVQDWLARRQSGTVTVKIDDDELVIDIY